MANASFRPVAPTGLPVEEVVPEVRAALAGPGHAVLVAEPGAGKTTVVPLRLLDADWLGGARIVVLEPRRLAARAAARRMADLLGEPVGRTVGYRTRDERVVGDETRIEVVTEGILVRRLQNDPDLPGVGLVVLDEVHERNLTTDLSLALTLDVRRGLRPDLRVLLMSATLDADRMARLVGGPDDPAPVVTSTGRTHPVAIRWHPPTPRERDDTHVARVVGEALRSTDGDVLVFLPGVAEIERVRRRLDLGPAVSVHPLHGSLPPADQDRALTPSAAGTRRVVLATDIAESSLTVAGVRVVVDAGRARIPRYEPATGRTGLVTVDASRAATDQRAGRAGRLGPGVAHRLWAQHDHRRRPAHPDPEIATVDLAGFALELACWGAEPDDLALPDRPPAAAWAEARRLLAGLGALDGDGRPTPLGRDLVRLPLHPRLGRSLLAGRARGSAWTGAVVAAVLDERDVLGGRRDDRSADLGERVRLVGGGDRLGAGDRVAAVRRRARDLHARGRRDRGRTGAPAGRDVEPDAIAELVAAGFPDRLAQARGGGRFRLRGGGGGVVPEHDPVAGAPFLAVAEVDTGTGDGRIRLAVALDAAEVEALVGGEAVAQASLRWDPTVDDLRERVEQRVDALVLHEVDRPATAGEATTAALVERVRSTAGGALPWTAAARRWQARVAFARSLDPDRWPDLDDDALLSDLDGWLAPHLVGATGRRDLERLDLLTILRAALPWDRLDELDRLAPATVEVAGGRALPVDYGDAAVGPVVEARAQDLFGTTVHPTVAAGRTSLVVRVLSPAGRPIQVTADLPGFWAGSWSEVRKEMAGRYPKHDWPTDPATASPRPPRRR